MKYSIVCERIKELRIQHGYTQTQLAEILGTSKSLVSSYENEIHLPPYNILIRLSSLFGVSCDYLLGIEQEKSISTKGLTNEQIKAIENIVFELKQMNQCICKYQES